MSENTGGTVRYHRAEYDPEKHPYEWWVQFTEDARTGTSFTAAEGEAMGLTPPPAPLVVTCNGHSVDLSDEEAEFYTVDWEGTVDHSPHGSCATKLAGLLRDARQDPQPASLADVFTEPPDDELLARYRSDKAATDALFGHPQPAPADSDDIDFDALPIGTVLKTYNGYYVTKGGNGNWFSSEEALAEPDHLLAPYTVVYQSPINDAPQVGDTILITIIKEKP